MSNMSDESGQSVKRHGPPRKVLPSKEFLNECLTYFPETGKLIWKKRPPHHFKCQKTLRFWEGKVGDEAFRAYSIKTGPKKGLKSPLKIYIDSKPYMVSHITFTLLGIVVEDGMEIDHKDRDVWNNRLENLRMASIPQNSANRVYNRKTNLPKGVHERNGKFSAKVGFEGRVIWLGTFPTPELAHEAYKSKAIELYGEFVCLHSRVVSS